MNQSELIRSSVKKTMVKADKMILGLFLIQFIAAVTIIPIGYGSHMLGFSLGGAILVIAGITYFRFKGTLFSRLLLGSLAMVFSALYIQQTEGRIETHFHIFGSMAGLLIYRDWRVIVVALLTVAVHHLSFTWLQLGQQEIAGYPIMIFNYGCSWGIAFLHAAWAIFVAVMVGIYAVILGNEMIKNFNLEAHMCHLAEHPQFISHQIEAASKRESEREYLAPVNNFIARMNAVVSSLRTCNESLFSTNGNLKQTSDDMNQVTNSLNVQTESVTESIQKIMAAVNDTQKNTEAASTTSREAASAAETISQQVGEVSENTDQLSERMTFIASAVEEMEASVSEIANNCSRAYDASEHSQKITQNASADMNLLYESAKKVTEVVALIAKIAEHTNLLALNSSIEAARAGEAGKGFAVVANEIKALANQTGEATEEITDQVHKMQDHANKSLNGFNEVTEHILELHGLVNGIATAVDQQASTTHEVASNITQSADAISNLNQSIQEINQHGRQLSANVKTACESSEQIGSRISEISRETKDIRNDLGELGILSSDTATSSTEINREVDTMSGLSNELSELLAPFDNTKQLEPA